jgi:biotin carboxyl carrier protein
MVSKITPAGVSTTNWATTGFAQFGITLDPAGNLYTGNAATSSVWKITPAGITINSWAATGSNPTALTVDSAGNVYTANLFSDNVSKTTSSSYPAAPARPATPSAVLGNAGSRTATVSVATNPLSAANGAPSSYTVTAVQDSSKQCTISFVKSSCVVSDLTNGTAYTFTAKAKLATWQTAASAASNSVTPAAAVPAPTPTPTPTPKPAKPAVAWSSSAKTKTVTAVITPVAGVTHTLTATSGRTIKKGSCKNVMIKQGKKKVARRSCTVKLGKGKWLAAVTPKKSSVSGTVNSKTYSFK